MLYRTLDPTTEELIRSYPELSVKDTLQRAEDAHHTFLSWRETHFADRTKGMKKLAALLRDQRETHAVLMTQEMGKPITEARQEVEKCAWVCEHFAEHAEQFLRVEKVATDAGKSYVRYDPLGVILGIMPWNFPYWQVFRFAAPTIMAGNAVVLKPAPNVPACSLAIADIFRQAGFPAALFQMAFCTNEAVAQLIASQWIQGVSLTGSDRAGSQVAEIAGRHLKKVVLELGGSDPFIVLADADLDAAVSAAIRSRMLNNGQSCIAAKRFIVVEKIFPRFAEHFIDGARQLKMGDPKDPATQLGPLARDDLLQNLIRQVELSKEQGAQVVTGGSRPKRKGYFYTPTVLTNVQPGVAAADEEVFGPVASLLTVRDEEKAIALANCTAYGLGASLWTRDVAQAERLAGQIEAGAVFINGMVKSDPRLPFGGIKRSGVGRELGAVGCREFTNIKTVWIA